MRFLAYLKNFDWVLFSVIILLISFGLVEIYSIAIGQNTDEAMLNFKKQILFVVVGVLLLFIFSFINYHHFRNFSNYIYIFIINTKKIWKVVIIIQLKIQRIA